LQPWTIAFVCGNFASPPPTLKATEHDHGQRNAILSRRIIDRTTSDRFPQTVGLRSVGLRVGLRGAGYVQRLYFMQMVCETDSQRRITFSWNILPCFLSECQQCSRIREPERLFQMACCSPTTVLSDSLYHEPFSKLHRTCPSASWPEEPACHIRARIQATRTRTNLACCFRNQGLRTARLLLSTSPCAVVEAGPTHAGTSWPETPARCCKCRKGSFEQTA
jgi:hypothetical protein